MRIWKRKKSRIERAQDEIEYLTDRMYRIENRYDHLRDHVHGDIEDILDQMKTDKALIESLDTEIWQFVHQLADDLDRVHRELELAKDELRSYDQGQADRMDQIEKLVENDGISINIATRKAYYNQEMSKIILDLMYALGKADKFRFIHHCETNTFAKEHFERHNKGIPFVRHTRPDECPLADKESESDVKEEENSS